MNLQTMKTTWHGESGKAESKVPGLVFLLIIVAAGFFTYKFGMPYWKNRSFEYAVSEVVKIDKFQKNDRLKTDQDLMAELQGQARKIFGKEMPKDTVSIQKIEKDRWQIEVTYTQTITLPFRKPIIKKYHFIKVGN